MGDFNPPMQVPIIKGDKVADNTDYRDFLPVNMTAVERQIKNASGYLLSHSGLTSFATGIGIDRGGIYNERLIDHYRISGESLISVAKDGAVTGLGAISGTDQASLAYSFNTQAIVADKRMWLYDGSTLSEVTDSDLGDPIDLTWIDGYYFLTDGEFLYHTDISDESSIDPLKFATAEFSPDPTLGVAKTSDNQVVAFGRYTTEYFINRATDNFAFQRISSKSVKAGIVGTHAKVELEGVFFFLGGGKDESVSMHYLSSGTYQTVATREIDKILSTYAEPELASAILEVRVEDRDKFIVVRLPNETLLYNHAIAVKMGLESAWTIVKSDIQGNTKWRGANGVFDPRVSGWIYGDNQDGRIGRLDNTVATQYGETVESIFATPLIRLETASVDYIEIDTIPGFQVNTDDVTVAVSLTYDGITYGKEWWALYGSKNLYSTRFILNRLGYVREFIGFKCRAASPERMAFSFFEVSYG